MVIECSEHSKLPAELAKKGITLVYRGANTRIGMSLGEPVDWGQRAKAPPAFFTVSVYHVDLGR